MPCADALLGCGASSFIIASSRGEGKRGGFRVGPSDCDDAWASLAAHILVAHERGLAADLSLSSANGSLEMLAAGDETRATVSAWLESYVSRPHPDLGRRGPVCPFVAPAVAAGAVWFAAHRFDGEPSLERMTRILEEALQCFQLLAWQEEKVELASLIVTFPDLAEDDWHLIDDAHRASKTRFVEAGLMLGQFHPACEEPAAHNAAFPVNRAPLPLMAIRHIASHDILFLAENPHWVEHFGAWLARRGVALKHPLYRERFEQVLRGVAP